jgi:solute carrier family 25 (mitochondrial phosphate transporter), member 23/24/25/41
MTVRRTRQQRRRALTDGNTEFRVFVEAAEKQLFYLFRSIDRDHDGKLDPNELQAAFKSAGLTVPRRRLAGFFDEIDMNHDGYISFDEWRYAISFTFPSQCILAEQ